MRKRRSPAHRLRSAVNAMPRPVREAMLRGIDGNEIIVGAYVDNATGGICPMLAAHRCGERTSFDTFANAWDQYTDADRRKPRPATQREVRTLRGYLEDSLSGEALPEGPLSAQVEDVKASRRRLAEAEAREDADVTIEDLLGNVTPDEPSPLADPAPDPDDLGGRPGPQRRRDDRELHRVAARD